MDDQDIWTSFTREIKPLARQKEKIRPELPKLSFKKNMRPRGGPHLPDPTPNQVVKVHEGMDRSLGALIRKGTRHVESTLDLHGSTQDQAHKRLYAFIVNAYLTHQRLVLVVTGRGEAPGGVLRQRVPHWLQEDIFRALIISVSQALPQDGGVGALYVLIRKQENVRYP